MGIPGREYVLGASYRYGFNGKENDNEVKGEGKQQDYGFRIYDPRLGKFLSVDPITKNYPSLTPYQFASNSPIKCIDLDGLEGDPVRGFEMWLGGIWDDLTSKKRWIQAVKNVNETLNPAYIAANHVSKIVRKKDLEGNPTYNSRAGLIAEAGVDVMAYVTGEKVFQIFGAYGVNTLEAELNSAARVESSTVSKPPANKPSLQAITAEETSSTIINHAKTAIKASVPVSTESNVALAAKYAKNRPKFRQGTVNKVWEEAKDVNGKVYDPNTFEELTWDKFQSRYDQWHMGHKPGVEYNKLVERLRKGEINQQQFLDEYNNPKNYRPEAPASNMSHKHEAPKTGG